jgi:NAD(P)-dependent dehydrogenase (short-subunit alcohol dehydrogenase family)
MAGMSLQDRVVIVTGGGSGIGRGIAELLAADGVRVAIAEIQAAAGAEVAESIRQAGGMAESFPTDVASEESVNRMAGQVLARFGSIYGLVNNAGIAGAQIEAEKMSTGEWERVLAVNLRGAFFCARAAIPHMRQFGKGSIVNIASVHAHFAFAGWAHYDASKGGLVSLTRTLALENGPHQVRSNVICPGYIDTPLWEQFLARQPNPAEIEAGTREWHPLRRRGTPADIAKATRFLLSDDAEWITGATLVVDGGLSVRYFGQ